jgi:hypothetical protein
MPPLPARALQWGGWPFPGFGILGFGFGVGFDFGIIC